MWREESICEEDLMKKRGRGEGLFIERDCGNCFWVFTIFIFIFVLIDFSQGLLDLVL